MTLLSLKSLIGTILVSLAKVAEDTERSIANISIFIMMIVPEGVDIVKCAQVLLINIIN